MWHLHAQDPTAGPDKTGPSFAGNWQSVQGLDKDVQLAHRLLFVEQTACYINTSKKHY